MRRIAVPPALDAEAMARLRAAIDAGVASGAPILIEPADRGRFFCSGFDLKALVDRPENEVARTFTDLLEATRSLFTAQVPVIVDVAGHAVGVGAILLLAGDVAVMHPKAKLRFPELALGRDLFDDVLALISHRGGPRWAERLVLGGGPVSAPDCLAAALLQRWARRCSTRRPFFPSGTTNGSGSR